MDENVSQQAWKQKTLNYVTHINAFVETGLRDGWDNVGKEPQQPDLKAYVNNVLVELRKNQTIQDPDFREHWPPAHAPFAAAGLLENKSQSLPAITLLEDGTILARVGATYQDGYVVQINGNDCQTLSDVELFGVCPNKRFFANVRSKGHIDVTDGWKGPVVSTLMWPTGFEGIPKKYASKIEIDVGMEQVIPFPCGQKALMVSGEGIFVLMPDKVHRLYPDVETMTGHFDWSLEEYPEDTLSVGISMAHGAISKDGTLIAVGCQDSSHLIFNQNYQVVGNVGHHSEYPHFAMFSYDDKMVAFNSCHFYNGCTIGVQTALLPNLETEPYEEDDRVTVLDESARVYAGVSRQGEFIIGDASGYIRAFSEDGNSNWQTFLGSSISGMDISDCGRFLLVSTYAGFLAKYDLESESRAPHQIGTGNQREMFRWIFWKDEPPLLW